ncbi:hypothetical protein PSECIP111854_02580 [Pseudoalteromonas sp. CIP111854]|uniref:Uncharacterized protein n=1 Tax=Pseudoalteromonas holothuriae TaxID=2963714 RepID=A0A9W4R033_9GAMM|nr:hypothetical protein PSECIP111854_02580 [Pseudoalteromonas sp. CIP111854]
MELYKLLYSLGWMLKGYEFLIITWFLITQLPTHKWSLFSARSHQLNSLQLHDLHSSFMVAVCVFLFHMLGSEMGQFFLHTLMPSLNDRIKVFYFTGIVNMFICILVLFCWHRLRKCLFNFASRLCLYISFIHIVIKMMQLIARGHFDYHELKPLYVIVGWLCNLTMMYAISIYPARQIWANFKKVD